MKEMIFSFSVSLKIPGRFLTTRLIILEFPAKLHLQTDPSLPNQTNLIEVSEENPLWTLHPKSQSLETPEIAPSMTSFLVLALKEATHQL